MKRNVTMRDIAQSLSVSTVTVSKALAGKEGVSDALREQIQRRAQELGYHAAPVVRLGDARDIGVIVADHFFGQNTSFYASMYKMVIQHLARLNCFGILEIITKEDERTGTLPAIIRNNRVQAIIVMGQLDASYVHELVKVDIPYLLLDFYNEDHGVEAIVSDNIYGSYLLTNHLIQQGHRDIGFFGSMRATSSIMDRYLGFYKSLLEHDLTLRPEWIIDDRDPLYGRALPKAALPQTLPDAFVCNCDQAAFFLIRQLRGMGLRVPEDISIVGFDDYLDEVLSDPPLTTYRVDQRNMAKIAAEEIVAKLNGRSRKHGRIVVEGEVVYRQSVRRITPPQ